MITTSLTRSRWKSANGRPCDVRWPTRAVFPAAPNLGLPGNIATEEASVAEEDPTRTGYSQTLLRNAGIEMSATVSPDGVCAEDGTGMAGLAHSARNASRVAATAAGAATFDTTSPYTRCTAKTAASAKQNKEAVHCINRTNGTVPCGQKSTTSEERRRMRRLHGPVTVKDMPNWCEIECNVSGTAKQIDEFESLLRGGANEAGTVSLLGTFLPRPEALENTTSPRRPIWNDEQIDAADEAERQKMIAENQAQAEQERHLTETCGAADWYEWSNKYWGVKWPDRSEIVERRARSLRIAGMCPWTVPTAGLRKISEIFPHLRFTVRWFECGMGFAGKAAYAGGEELYLNERTYHGMRGG